MSLDVYGQDAGGQPAIERAVAETGSGGFVALRGYTSEGPQRFAEASFSLMTSATEGQSLVLLESMAQGCVPISYDVRYGPAELVVDGESGFLVPDGDVDALADTVLRFLAMPGRQVARMRDAGRQRLEAFSDEEAYRRWVGVQHDALRLRPYRAELVDVAVTDLALRVAEPLLGVDATLAYGLLAAPGATPAGNVPEARLLVVGRRGGRPWRRRLAVTDAGDGSVRLAGEIDPAAVAVGRSVGDVFLELQLGTSVRRVRLRGEQEVEASGGRLFLTTNGNLSLRLGGAG